MRPSFVFVGLCLAAFCASRDLQAKTISDLRILVATVSTKSQQSFAFEGQALMDQNGKPVRNDRVVCRKEAAIASPLLSGEASAPSKVSWYCRSGENSWPVKGRLKFSDRSGFLRIQEKWYRGSLELVTTGETLWVVNTVDIESYLTGLMHGEMPHFYELEALKAQAVAARSYAVATALERRAAGAFFDLRDSDRDQMYPGAHTESKKGDAAVLATKGEYLTFQSSVLKSFYHAASGGHSELPANVWGEAADSEPGAYATKLNPWDKGNYAWKLLLAPEIFSKYSELGTLIDIQVSRRSAGFRVTHLKLIGSESEKELPLRELEKIFGPSWFKSRKFDIVKDGRNWKIMGEGWGHGVGLSQVAANNMARAAKTYREILEFHYPNALVEKIAKPQKLKILAGALAR